MYIKVIKGKVNYKDRVYNTGEMLECKKDIGEKLIKSKLCVEVNEELFRVLTKQNNVVANDNINDKTDSRENKTIDDLRDAL
ncbi:Phage protein [Candidatus Arthromitus sp. SFB-mouse-NL]|uniref:hypothetical protein n=1 Tax=Candidatus Arthromitus sp. SFB-mouse-NL TaxID=1508644 RepID=UPI00049B2631|nr:hypothetical protein [Candidatus Arthromitus sp. SFB-mouse-NL]AID45440.1 Phage protein [Candidatus Arthromitus sp. SFB-mouse-NL]